MMIRSLLLMMLLITVYACSRTDSSNKDTLTVSLDGYTSIDSKALENDLNSYQIGTLSQLEREGLLFLYEEEKLASDLFGSFDHDWNQPVFEATSSSESTHSDAVNLLIKRYSETSPSKAGDGEFNNQELQSLYSGLYSEGSASFADALNASAAVEELSLIDTQVQLDRIDDNDDIRFVYEQLLLGSRNHLRAFVNSLEALDTNYAPRYLTTEEYKAIITISIEIPLKE